MMSRGAKLAIGVGMAVIVVAISAFFLTREELASGVSEGQEWRLVASWTPMESCIRLYEADSEGGACGFAIPPTLNETTSWLVCHGEDAHTLVAGPVTDRAESVRVELDDGRIVASRLHRVLRLTFFVAEAPGVHALDGVVALNHNSDIIDEMQHTPYPPPTRGDGSPSCGERTG